MAIRKAPSAISPPRNREIPAIRRLRPIRPRSTACWATALRGGGAGLYDEGSQNLTLPGKFQKTEMLAPTPPSAYAKFANNPQVIALHDAEMKAYGKLAAADLALKKAQGGPTAAPAPPQDVARAQARFEEAAKTFQKAQTALKKNIYVLD